MYKRKNRSNDEARELKLTSGLMDNAYADVLISTGKTKVLCTASVDTNLPPFINEEKMGWLSAEYNMLPGSTTSRKRRSIYKPDSRGIEINRIIGRSLRAAIDLKKIAGQSITIDCDVVQADGGTRTASITGGYIALEMAVNRMLKENLISENPIINQIASVSAGLVNNEILLDLDYVEDSQAEVDLNIVMNNNFNLIEIQGTGEKGDLSRKNLLLLLDYCEAGIRLLFEKQKFFINRE